MIRLDPDRAKFETRWHKRLARLGGAMLRVGWSTDAVCAAIIAENVSGGVMRSDDADAVGLARWITDHEPFDGEKPPAPWATDPGNFALAWRRDASLNPLATIVLLALAGRANLDGRAIVGIGTLAKDAASSPRRVVSAVHELVAAGAVVRHERRTWHGQRGLSATNAYHLQHIPDRHVTTCHM